jgi:hypothetical protein
MARRVLGVGEIGHAANLDLGHATRVSGRDDSPCECACRGVG